MKKATQYLIPAQLRTAEITPLRNRMDLREGFQTTSVQRLGRAAEALQKPCSWLFAKVCLHSC